MIKDLFELSLLRVVQFFLDTLIIYLFYRDVQPWDYVPAKRQAASVLLLFPVILLYIITNNSIGFTSHLLYRIVWYALYGICAKGIKPPRSLFCAVYTCVCYTACQNIFTSQFLNGINKATLTLLPNEILNILLCCLIRFAFFFIVFLIIHRLTPLSEMKEISTSEWVLTIIIAGIEVYSKSLLRYTVFSQKPFILRFSLFGITLHLFMLGFLVFFERYQKTNRIYEDLLVQETLNNSRIKNLENLRTSDEIIRNMHHDMKNHLLAIQALSLDDSSGKTGDYINNLLDMINSFDVRIETGNTLLNGLLNQKIRDASAKQIEVDAIVNFNGIDFIENTDLCTIFGNALDNAIEASEQVEDENRIIIVRSTISANQLVLRFSNTYKTPLQTVNGILATTKKDTRFHGIGLRNIKKTVQKYDGIMSIDASNDSMFTLNIVIGIPQSVCIVHQ